MKQWILPAVFTALAIPASASAENYTYDPIARAHKMFKLMDKNQDNSVSMDEYLRPSNYRFQRFDTDKNSVITREEMYEFWKNKRKIKTDNVNAWEGPTDAHFKRFDKNKDDRITQDEYLASSLLRFKSIDTDESKSISQEELNNHWQDRKKELDEYNSTPHGEDD